MKKEFSENERAKELTRDMANGTNYFDENESREGGSLIDEATGESYKNDTSMDYESPETSIVHEHKFGDVTGEDLAEIYLRKHDPEYTKKRPVGANRLPFFVFVVY
jgi:hypothetical protein